MGFGFGEVEHDSGVQIPPSSTEKGSSHLPVTSPTQETPALSRLKRRNTPDPSEEDEDAHSSSSHTLDDDEDVPTNAFDTLMKAARRPRERVVGKSNLLDEQAEESDEDNGWGPIGGPEDEDEDVEDDGYVPDLVDDQHIDEEEKKRQDELAAEKARFV